MKTNQPRKRLTFGEFIANVYKTSGSKQARAEIQLAVNSHLVHFLGRHRFEISNRRDQGEQGQIDRVTHATESA